MSPAAILAALTRGPASAHQLAAALGVTPETARTHVEAARARGLAARLRRRWGDGARYELTPAGRRAVEVGA